MKRDNGVPVRVHVNAQRVCFFSSSFFDLLFTEWVVHYVLRNMVTRWQALVARLGMSVFTNNNEAS